jgi:multidrug efflux pump
MSFTDIFIRRPVLSGVISVLILLLGLKSLFSMQVRQYPDLTNTVITVTTTYPGATADLMQGFVTTPIQKSVASAEGVDYLTATSQQGVSVVNAYIRLNFPPNRALTEVMAKIQEVNSILPKEVNSPVIVKTTGVSYAVLYVGFSSGRLTAQQTTDYLNREILPRLSTVSGVGSIDVIGGQTFAMRLWIDDRQMASRNISYGELNAALLRNNYQSAPGAVKGYFVVNTIEANTSLQTVEEFKDIIVKSVNGSVVRVNDIAKVELASESYDSMVKMNDKKSVFLGVKTTPTANPLTVVKDVRQVLEDYRHNFPPGMKMEFVYDATKFIQASIKEVVETLVEASLIVIVVIFLFLGSFRAVFIPLVTIPLSIIGVTTILLALGFSINILTLLAMVLAIGLVVDDAIVVVENVYRHLAEGQTPFQAAIRGTREIAVPIITMTITLVAVYVPIAFMGGLTGTLFQEFALTLAGAVVISGIIALTLSPMMCSQILTKDTLESPFAKMVESFFHKLSQMYHARLVNILRNRAFVLFGFFVILSLSFFFTFFVSRELAPPEDQGIVMVATKGPQNANIDFMAYYTDQIIHKIGTYPEGELTFAFAGMQAVNMGFAGLILKPWEERDRSAGALQQLIQNDVSQVVGLNAFAFQPAPLPGSSGGMPVQFVMSSLNDHQVIYEVMKKLQAAAQKSGLFMVTDMDLDFNNPVVKLTINRAKANQLGISLQDIGMTLSQMMGGNYVNRFSLMGRSYEVIPMTPRSHRLSPESILGLYVATAKNKQVPLSTFADVSVVTEPNQLYQFNQINSSTFQAVPMPWVKMGEVIQFLEDYARNNFPQGFSYDFLGESRQYKEEGNALYMTFIFAIIIIFLVLAAQFESLRDPFIVMLSVPMSIFGALLVLFIGLSTMNIYSQIGLVTLVGLITKHGILIVEFANQLRREHGLTKEQAILKSASIRLRPILMTTAAMVVGLIPLLMANGAGAASRSSIGITIVAGMLIGTFFTIFVVPSFYMMISRDTISVPQEV